MEKSLCKVKYVLNPDIKHWAVMAELIAKTVDWSLTVEDYTTWLNSFEKFWLFAAFDKDSNDIIGTISTAYDRSTSKNDEDDCYCYGFDKILPYQHVGAVIAPQYLIIPKADPSYISKDLEDVDMEKLTSYDASISHRKREKYVKRFISTDNCYVKVAFDKSDNIVGYCSVRTSLANTLCTAPLYADNENVAKTLLAGVLPMIKEISICKYFSSVFPDINEDAHRLFESLGGGHTIFEPYTQCAFRKKILPFEEAKVYGTLECGNSFVWN